MYIKLAVLSVVILFFSACGGGSSDSTVTPKSGDVKYSLEYNGLLFFSRDMPKSAYKLTPLSDSEFNELNTTQKFQVADKLLSSLFFGYNYKELEKKIESGEFLSSVYEGLSKETTDKEWLESYILDSDYFVQYSNAQATEILTRFYAAKELDRYFFDNWIAYILTQTIMFSPAYELESSHYPNVARTYNRIVKLLEDETTFANLTYIHMMSEDNWRRFRSPEDNGREMLEIFTSDINDSKVPLAGKALQNWKLDRDNDTLVVGLNENRDALALFGTTIYNGDDFYRELAKSDAFKHTVVKRLVEFFFTDLSAVSVESITDTILQSKPQTWQDILKQILFSKEYLLYNQRAKSAEELFFSLTKKMDFKHRDSLIHYFRYALDAMHQATMKYKLGKLERVPLDTLSFINTHKYFREQILLRYLYEKYKDDYKAWASQGWRESFMANENFEYDYSDEERSFDSLVHYIFTFMLARDASKEELEMFKNHMFVYDDGVRVLKSEFNMFTERNTRESNKRHIVLMLLDYISRVDELYLYKEVK